MDLYILYLLSVQSQQTKESGGGVEQQCPLPAAAVARLRFLLVVTELGQGACAFHAVEKIILKDLGHVIPVTRKRNEK